MITNHIAPRFEPAGGYFKTETTMNKNLTSAIIIGFFVDLAFCFAPKIFSGQPIFPVHLSKLSKELL